MKRVSHKLGNGDGVGVGVKRGGVERIGVGRSVVGWCGVG